MFRRFVVLVVATLPFAAAADVPNVRVVEEIAAKVNGDIITRGELTEKRKEIEAYFRSNGLSGAKLADAVKQQESDSLRDEIDTLLLVQKGKDLNVNVDSDVTRYFADLQVESKLADPDKFHEWLRQQSGMTYEELKDRKKKELLARRVVSQEIGSRIAIPEADLRKYYEEHKSEFVREEQVFLSQIILSTEGKTPAQVATLEAKAKDVVARARKGEKFSDLAHQNSDEVESANNGGYAGAYKRGLLMKPIEDIVFKENKGYITDPIKIPSGYVIFKVEERYGAGQASFEEVKDDVQARLSEPKMTPKVREFLTRLRQEAFLEIKEGYIDSGAAPGKDTRWHEVAQLKPATTTKEEVAAHATERRKFLFVPIPGTHKKVKPKIDTKPAATPAPAETPVKQ